MKLILVVSCLFLSLLVEISDAKYEIILDRVDTMEDDKMFKLVDLRVKKVKDNKYVANGKVDILQEITDNHELHVSFYNFDAGQYKKYFIEKNFTKLCTSFTEDELMKDALKDIIANTESKIELGKCPWPAGIVNAKNYMPEDSFLPPYISMASEKWRADIVIYKNGELQGGLILYALLRNDETLMKIGR